MAAQGFIAVAFGLQAMNMVVAPQFARLHATGDLASLQWTVTFSARVILLLTLPLAALLLFLSAGPSSVSYSGPSTAPRIRLWPFS